MSYAVIAFVPSLFMANALFINNVVLRASPEVTRTYPIKDELTPIAVKHVVKKVYLPKKKK